MLAGREAAKVQVVSGLACGRLTSQVSLGGFFGAVSIRYLSLVTITVYVNYLLPPLTGIEPGGSLC